jgi:hypothetical protein
MSATELVEVPFHGDTLAAARVDGKVWVVVKRVCEALGLDRSGQLSKLKTQAWSGVEHFSLPDPRGRSQRIACIPLKSLPMWLATIDAARVAPRVRPKIERYQLEAADALHAYFFGAAAEQATREQFRMLLDCTQLVQQCRQLMQDNEAYAVRLRTLEARLDQAQAFRPLQVQYLSPAATISRSDYNKLRRLKAELARSEVRAKLWLHVRAAHRDIDRDLGEACTWGGSCQHWVNLPAGLIHTAFVVLKRRQKIADRLGGTEVSCPDQHTLKFN